MIDFGESEMIKISGREGKSNTYNGFSGNISFFIQPLRSGRIWHKVNFLSWV